MTEPQRVMLVIQPTVTGAALHVAQLAKWLNKDEFDVTVVSPGESWLADKVRSDGVRHIALNLQREIRPVRDLLAAASFLRLIRREKPRVLHLHSAKAGFIGRVMRPIHRVPVVLYTTHGFAFKRVKRWRRALYLQLERMAAAFGDRMICVSASEKQSALEYRIASDEAITVVPNGVELPQEPVRSTGMLRRHLDVDERCKILAMPARLQRPKLPEDLVHAASQLARDIDRNSFRLVFIGDGPLENATRLMVRELGLRDVVAFLGYRSDMELLMADIDVVILASQTEGMPYTLLEAMAAGKPVVGTNVPGIVDLIRHGENGYLYSAGDGAEMASYLSRLLGDKALRDRLGARGRADITLHYQSTTMARATEKVYRELLGKKLH